MGEVAGMRAWLAGTTAQRVFGSVRQSPFATLRAPSSLRQKLAPFMAKAPPGRGVSAMVVGEQLRTFSTYKGQTAQQAPPWVPL